jgi:predicted secreted protein
VKWTSIVAIYALFWAMSFFFVLPFRLQHAGEDERVAGQADSAPPRFSFWRTAKWTTLVAVVLFGLYYANYVNGWVGVETFDLVPAPANG